MAKEVWISYWMSIQLTNLPKTLVGSIWKKQFGTSLEGFEKSNWGKPVKMEPFSFRRQAKGIVSAYFLKQEQNQNQDRVEVAWAMQS